MHSNAECVDGFCVCLLSHYNVDGSCGASNKSQHTGPIHISVPLSPDTLVVRHIVKYHTVDVSTFISIFRNFVKLYLPSSNNSYTCVSISMLASSFYHPLVILVRSMPFSPHASSSRHFPASFSPTRLLFNIMAYLYFGLTF